LNSKMTNSEDKLYTLKEAAEYLRVGVRSLERMKKENQITYIEYSRKKVFIRKSDCDEFLDARTVKSARNKFLTYGPIKCYKKSSCDSNRKDLI